MPLKSQPGRLQPPRGSRTSGPESESSEIPIAPSTKESLVDNVDPNIFMETGTPSESKEHLPLLQPSEQALTQPFSPAPNALANLHPPRRSVQRLASVLPRNTLNNTTLDGSDSRPVLKFKPKSFIRRSKEERENFEKSEADRQAARLATESGHTRGAYRGRGRGGPEEMSRWKNERFNVSGEASGLFGGATVGEKTARGRSRGGYGGRGGDSRSSALEPDASTSTANRSSRVKKEPLVKPETDKDGNVILSSSTSKLKPKKTKIKKEDQAPTYVSSEGEFDSEGGKKVDIERINLITSSEDSEAERPRKSEISKGKGRQRTPFIPNNTLRPIRVQRQEHVERSVGVNTDASSHISEELRRRAKAREEAAGSLFLSDDDAEIVTMPKSKSRRKPKDVEFIRDERKWKGVYRDDDDKGSVMKIKEEPKDDENAMEIDSKEHKDDEFLAADQDITNPSGDPAMDIEDEESGVPLQSALNEALPIGRDLSRVTQDFEKQGAEAEEMDSIQPSRISVRVGHYFRRGEHLSIEDRDQIMKELDALWAVDDDEDAQLDTSTSVPITPKTVHKGDNDIDDVHDSVFMDDVDDRASYIFQLPPIVPALRDISKKPTHITSEEKQEVKKEVKREDKKGKGVAIDLPKFKPSSNPFNVKQEPDTKPDHDKLAKDSAVSNAYIAGGINPPAGCAGVLEIYAKGAMRASWGGMALDVERSGADSMNQELLLIDYNTEVVKIEDEGENRWEEKITVGQKAWTMGQTQPGYTCVPDLDILLAK